MEVGFERKIMVINEFMLVLSFVSIYYFIIVVIFIDKLFFWCMLYCYENEM